MNSIKKISILILLSLSSSILLAKSTLNDIKKFPVAIMSIVLNSTFNWVNESSDSDDSQKSTKILFPEIEQMINQSFTDNGFTLIPKDKIISTDEYKNATESQAYLHANYTSPDGYKMLPQKNKIAFIVKNKTNAENFIYISLFLEKTIASGNTNNGSFKAFVTCYIDIASENGQILSSSKTTVLSDNIINITNGNYDSDSFLSIYSQTIKAAITKAIAALK